MTYCVLKRFKPQFDLVKSINHNLSQPSETWLAALSDAQLQDIARHVNYVSIMQWPHELGSLAKNIQSKSFFAQFFKDKGYQRHNGTSVDAYVESAAGSIAAKKEKIQSLINKVEEQGVLYQDRIKIVSNWFLFLSQELLATDKAAYRTP